jgi:hypothetical protein
MYCIAALYGCTSLVAEVDEKPMRSLQHKHLNAPVAQWFASASFCTGIVSPAAMRTVRATKADPATSGGPVEGGIS